MPTILDKDLVRESTVKIDNREILVTLGSQQNIKMKLKGMKSGEVSIGIEELYNQLTGNVSQEKKVTNEIKSIKREEKVGDDVMISLYDLRSINATSGFDVQIMNKLDGFISELIEKTKKQKKR